MNFLSTKRKKSAQDPIEKKISVAKRIAKNVSQALLKRFDEEYTALETSFERAYHLWKERWL